MASSQRTRSKKPTKDALPTVPVDVWSHRHPELERALQAAPEERARFAAYAEWLGSQGHPLGDVIMQQLAAETEPPKQRKLKVGATRALTAYIEEYLAPRYPELAARMLAFKLRGDERGPDKLGSSQSASITWRRGLIHTIGTWEWPAAMREQALVLLGDRHALLLRELSLRDHVVDDLAFVSHLAALETLELRWANLRGLTDLGPLARLRRLSWIDVRQSGVTDLAPVRALPLRKLIVVGCPVADLTPLANHPTLEYLDVGETHVEDITPLLGCPRLCNVSLWDARVPTDRAQDLVRSIRHRDAQPSPGSDYEPYVSHNDADWYAGE